VVAGLAGISRSQLPEFDRGERALDRLSQIVALANALRVAPSELTRSPNEPGRAARRDGFGPGNMGLWHMAGALEAEDPDTAVRVAEGLRPQEHPMR
jgi:transcriptional regulator with XRE-family HTH domain